MSATGSAPLPDIGAPAGRRYGAATGRIDRLAWATGIRHRFARTWSWARLATVLAVAPATVIAPARAADEAWISAHHRQHPLVGTVWRGDGARSTWPVLARAVSGARFVLLGESHNNPDHHRLQARIIAAIARDGRRPAVVFEMIPRNLQAVLDRQATAAATDLDELGKALGWSARGWPAWQIYRPIFEVARRRQLPLVAGNLTRKTRNALMRPGDGSDDIAWLELDVAMAAKRVAAMKTEIFEAHCGFMPKSAMAPMVQVQRGRDASLALALLAGDDRDGAVLVAGAGHVRRDWGVPLILGRKSPNAGIIAVAFIEVTPGKVKPDAYYEQQAGLEQPFDFLVFTPRAEIKDYCAALAKRFGKAHKRESK